MTHDPDPKTPIRLQKFKFILFRIYFIPLIIITD